MPIHHIAPTLQITHLLFPPTLPNRSSTVSAIREMATRCIKPLSTTQRHYSNRAFHEKLRQIAPTAVTLPKHIAPYHKRGACESYAENVLSHFNQQISMKVEESKLDKNTKSVRQTRKNFGPKLASLDILDYDVSTNLLALYHKKGAFILRAPGLSKKYWDHAVTVTAVVAVTVQENGQQKIRHILCCLDRDDLGDDPYTIAARNKSVELDRSMHELDIDVNESDVNHGFRMIDIHAVQEAVIKHQESQKTIEHTPRLTQHELVTLNEERYQTVFAKLAELEKRLPSEEIEEPYVAFKKIGSGRLTDQELHALSQEIASVYHTDVVEKSLTI